MKTVLVFGTFDFLHIGHIHMLQAAKKKGDKLVVAIARDIVVKKIKGKYPIHDERERKSLLVELRCIDTVIFGDKTLSTYKVLQQVKPDIIAVGYDQTRFELDMRAYIQKKGLKIRVIQLQAYKPESRKSSKIKNALKI